MGQEKSPLLEGSGLLITSGWIIYFISIPAEAGLLII